MDKKWKIEQKAANRADMENLRQKLAEKGKDYSPVILELLRNRGISREDQIEKFFSFDYDRDIPDPFLFGDMERAVERIAAAKEKSEKIAVFGDYDADGVTATALLVQALGDLDFRNVIPYIPDRQIEGYGLNGEALNFLKKEGVSLVITADCGVTNVEEVKQANGHGIDVVITDHHHVPKRLPKALAVINPHRGDSKYPFKDLSGVGTAFKLAQALYQKIKPEEAEKLKWFLDLVAIGTIADCVPLLGENRVLAKYGLIVLSKTRRAGFQEMFKVGRILIDDKNIPDAQQVAFQVAPRINAAGRMDHASVSYNLIMETDKAKARQIALEVEASNQSRQKITAEIVREIKVIADNSFKDKKLIFAANENWRVGILGLVAGKIADQYNKVTAVFQKQEQEFVGSFRSIPQLNIVEALEKCADLCVKFGGHAQAAGARVAKENIDEFYRKLSELIEKELAGKDISPETEIDMEIRPEEMSWELMMDIKKMEPFGEGNPEPVFLSRRMTVEEAKIVGNGNKHLKLSLRPEGGSPKIFDSIGFGLGEKFGHLKAGDQIDAVFNLREDEWNGNRKMQLRLVDLKLSDD